MAKWDKPGTGSGVGTLGGQPQPIPVYTGIVPNNPIVGSDQTGAGVTGESNIGPGVLGLSYAVTISDFPPGSGTSDGVQGVSDGNGVHGISHGAGSGVWGENKRGGSGVAGTSATGVGVYGESRGYDGVSGISHSLDHAGVSGHNDNGGAAGWFGGDVTVTGSLNVNNNLNISSQGDIILNDCAEHFDVVDATAEPGTVMAIDQDGNLRPSNRPYDKRVAGVVSGAGNFRPGIILGKQQSPDRLLIALLGKVFCKVDASSSPIEVGDLLTTSQIPGHAMKAADSSRAFGAVIGKALRPLAGGRGLIPILIALQ